MALAPKVLHCYGLVLSATIDLLAFVLAIVCFWGAHRIWQATTAWESGCDGAPSPIAGARGALFVRKKPMSSALTLLFIRQRQTISVDKKAHRAGSGNGLGISTTERMGRWHC